MSLKFGDIIKNPFRLIITLGHREKLNWIDDETYLRIIYRIKLGKKLNLDNPQTYNEKLQWMKLYNRQQIYTKLVDKYEVKSIIAKQIGEKYIIPTLGVWDRFEDINFSSLPHQFVLKCTHDSGGLIVVKDKSKLNLNEARKIINRCLAHNFFWGMREWPYKDVKPKIIAEKYMEDTKTSELRDYKFFCFDGQVKALFIASDRMAKGEETKFDFFNENFSHLPITNGHPNAKVLPEKPVCFEEMKHLASKLSNGIPHVRVDFYEVNGKVYFGEMTFFHYSGLVPFVPEKWDYTFGSWLKLPSEKKF